MLYTWKLLMEIILRSSIFFILTSRALPKGLHVSTILDSLSWRGFWLAVKLYRHTGTNWLLDPSLCDCMDSLCCDHWRAVVIVGCLVLAPLPTPCFPVNMRTWSNMKNRNIDFWWKVVPRLSSWNRKVCSKAISPFVTVEVQVQAEVKWEAWCRIAGRNWHRGLWLDSTRMAGMPLPISWFWGLGGPLPTSWEGWYQ